MFFKWLEPVASIIVFFSIGLPTSMRLSIKHLEYYVGTPWWLLVGLLLLLSCICYKMDEYLVSIYKLREYIFQKDPSEKTIMLISQMIIVLITYVPAPWKQTFHLPTFHPQLVIFISYTIRNRKRFYGQF